MPGDYMTNRSNTVAFVIPLKSPAVARDWDLTVALCLRTLSSIFNQTDSNYIVHIACNAFPMISTSDKLFIHEHDYPVPQTWGDGHKDKYAKLGDALSKICPQEDCYVMKMDADDLISRHLVTYINVTQKDGYFIGKGYLATDSSSWMKYTRQFHLSCGSSNVVRLQPDELPSGPRESFHTFEIMKCGHNIFKEFYSSKGKEIVETPFPAGMYITGSGENHSDTSISWNKSRVNFLRNLVYFRYLSKNVKEEFSYDHIKSYKKVVQNRLPIVNLPLAWK